jgi:hypothetical protein
MWRTVCLGEQGTITIAGSPTLCKLAAVLIIAASVRRQSIEHPLRERLGPQAEHAKNMSTVIDADVFEHRPPWRHYSILHGSSPHGPYPCHFRTCDLYIGNQHRSPVPGAPHRPHPCHTTTTIKSEGSRAVPFHPPAQSTQWCTFRILSNFSRTVNEPPPHRNYCAHPIDAVGATLLSQCLVI